MRRAIFIIAQLTFIVIIKAYAVGNSGIEFSQLLSILINKDTIWQNDIIQNAILKTDCCTKHSNDSIYYRDCLRVFLNNKEAHLSNGAIIYWGISIKKNFKSILQADIYPCASSYKIFGSFNVEEYLIKNGFKIDKKLCNIENKDSEGYFVYYCLFHNKSFWLKYNYLAASGGYSIDFEYYSRELPSKIIQEAQMCQGK
jgi:hypothetical protein